MNQVTHTNSESNESQNPNIAIASIPSQKWAELYDNSEALKIGTIFKNLHKPFFMGGDVNAR